jgi:hypothetical protein
MSMLRIALVTSLALAASLASGAPSLGAAAAPPASSANALAGRVLAVHDGARVLVRLARGERKRFVVSGVRVPRCYSRQAKLIARRYAVGERVRVRPTGRGRASRAAKLRLAEGEDLGLLLVRRGAADAETPAYRGAEREARLAGRGHWSAWRCGGPRRPLPGDTLPSPLAVSMPTRAAEVDDLARTLATEVEDPAGAVPALLSAFRTAGISVRRSSGRMAVRAATPTQGFSMDAWEVVGVADAYRNPSSLSLADVGTTLRKAVPAFRRADVAAMLLSGIRRAAEDRRLTVRMWGRLIVERGRRAAQPYDILDPRVGAGAVALDPLAQALVFNRLAMDLRALVVRAGRQSARAAAGRSSPPCTLSEAAAKVMDAAALAETEGFGQLMSYLEKHGMETAGTLATAADVGGAVLSYVKLAYMALAFEAKISMDGAGPLIRTKLTQSPGTNRVLRLDARWNIGNGQWVNCLRLALAQLGLDIDVPNDGPISDAKVHWALREGGPSGSGRLPIVQFWGDSISPTARKTDKEGRSRIGIQGYPQPRPIPEPAVPWPRHATVQAELQIQAADVLTDLMDAIGSRGGWGLATIPAELLQRTRWLWTVTERIPVTDWRPALLLDADITHDLTAAQGATSRYTVRVRDLKLEPDGAGQLSGLQPLQVVEWRQDPYEPRPGCRGLTGVASVTTHEPFRVISLPIDSSTGTPGAMQLEPGLVDFFTEHLTCSPIPPHPCCIHLIDEHHWIRWSTLWGRVLGDDGTHAGSPRGTVDGWEQVAEDGQPGPDGIIARKTIDHDGGKGLGTLRAVLKLKVEGR